MIPCRVVPPEAADGPTNMAIDEVLLDSVAADPTRAVLRLYTWSGATLSLGYFQPIALAEADPRWRGVPLVRRSTGGGALLHDREVTYALVVPSSHPLSRRSPDLYRAVHEAISGLLDASGLAASRRGESGARPPDAPKPFLCFADRDAEDVVSGRVKLVGSAQRRRAGAVLQHGSLLLGRSPAAPELPGLADLAPVIDPDPAAWAHRLARAIPASIGVRPEPGPLAEAERRAADRVADAIYRNPDWTRKR